MKRRHFLFILPMLAWATWLAWPDTGVHSKSVSCIMFLCGDFPISCSCYDRVLDRFRCGGLAGCPLSLDPWTPQLLR